MQPLFVGNRIKRLWFIRYFGARGIDAAEYLLLLIHEAARLTVGQAGGERGAGGEYLSKIAHLGGGQCRQLRGTFLHGGIGDFGDGVERVAHNHRAGHNAADHFAGVVRDRRRGEYQAERAVIDIFAVPAESLAAAV